MARSAVAEPLTVGALGGAALVLINPPDSGIPWCPSALIFGVVCPLCGLTRGVARLVRGEFAASVVFHPMAGVVLAVAAGAWVAWLGRRAGWWSWRNRTVERIAVAGVAVGLIAVWVWRAMAGTLPAI
jgi:hypothetical protein